jgi:DNA mismatch repair protein MutS2
MDAYTLEKIEFNAVRQIIAGFCSCSLGRAAAGRIRPGTQLNVVQKRLEQTSQMVEVVREVGLPPFGGVTDISAALERATPAHGAGPEDFAEIASTLTAAGLCREFLKSLPEELTHMRELARGLADFTPEVDAIRTVIADDGTIRDDASARLLELRRHIAETTREIHDVIHNYLHKPEVRKLLTGTNVTLHGDRYVLPVRVDHRGRLPGVVHRASNTGQTVFVEPNASVEMNNRLVDLHDHERQEIERLLSDLSVKISHRAEAITTALKTLGQVDLLSAKAQYAYQFDMTAPTVTQQGELEFFRARHPILVAQAYEKLAADLSADRATGLDKPAAGLSEQLDRQVVPIDVRLGGDFDILVITGSNTGGKTVTMKTVALLVAMAQAGLHLPVRRGATMPIFRDVLIDIGDEQSLQQSLSTFGGHIERLKYILKQSESLGRAGLVLLDELGSGTDPDEGGAIGQAVLDELRRIGCMAMVSTHISVLKAYALNHDRVDNASVEFDTATLRPTYHLRIGTPGESHAITVAEKLGLPRSLTDSARRHLGTRGVQFRKAMRKTGAARRQAEQARAEAAAAQVQAETHTEELQEKMADVGQLKEDFTTWLARLTELKPGDEIRLPDGKTGTLARLELHKQLAVVNTGSIQIEVPLTELMPDLGQAEVRDEMVSLRKRAGDESAKARADLAEAGRLKQEAEKHERQHRQRARQFDAWLNKIARVKVGDEVAIAHKPGRGKVVKVDFPGLRATVEVTGGRTLQLSLQELFPQIGPFAPKDRPVRSPSRSHGQNQKCTRPQAATTRQIRHGRTEGKAAQKNRQAVLNTPPGQRVFVLPFNTTATLVRIDEAKDQAVVLRGAFEMQVALSDLEPLKPKSTNK